MKWWLLFFLLPLLISCSRFYSDSDVILKNYSLHNLSAEECKSNDDCVRSGCSGIICKPKTAKTIFTTCEFLPEYECYRLIGCVCIDGKCQWNITEEFNACISEKRAS